MISDGPGRTLRRQFHDNGVDIEMSVHMRLGATARKTCAAAVVVMLACAACGVSNDPEVGLQAGGEAAAGRGVGGTVPGTAAPAPTTTPLVEETTTSTSAPVAPPATAPEGAASAAEITESMALRGESAAMADCVGREAVARLDGDRLRFAVAALTAPPESDDALAVAVDRTEVSDRDAAAAMGELLVVFDVCRAASEDGEVER